MYEIGQICSNYFRSKAFILFLLMNYFRDDIFIKQFGNRLKQVRKAKKVSQEELSYRTGFELSQIGRIERGTVNTSISHVSAIAKALDVPTAELFNFDPY